MKPAQRVLYGTILLTLAALMVYLAFGTDLLGGPATPTPDPADPFGMAISEDAGTPAPTPEPLFPEVYNFALLTGMTVEDNIAGERVVIEQAPEGEVGWVISEFPLGTNEGVGIDQERIEQGLVSIPRLTPTSYFDDVSTDELGNFGLESPSYTLSFTTTFDFEFAVDIGNVNPSGSAYYVRRHDKDRIFLVSKVDLDSLINFFIVPPFVMDPSEASTMTAQAAAGGSN